LEHPALGVDDFRGRGQPFRGDGVAGQAFQGVLVADEFRPEQVAVAGSLALGHFEDMHGGIVGEGLVGFLFPVAGGFADDQIAGFDIGAKPGQFEPDKGFDEVAGVAGQDGFGLFGAGLGAGAKPHLDGAGGQRQLLGHEHAKGAHDLGSGRLGVEDLLDALAVNLGQHEIEVFRAGKPAFLGQEDVAVELPQHAEQRLVALDVEVEPLPHGLMGRIAHGCLRKVGKDVIICPYPGGCAEGNRFFLFG